MKTDKFGHQVLGGPAGDASLFTILIERDIFILLKQIKQLASAGEFEFPLIPLIIVGGAMYIATCLLLAWFASWLERRMGRSARRTPPATGAGTLVEIGAVTGE